MSENVGHLCFDQEDNSFLRWKPYSEKLAIQIDTEVDKIVNDSYIRCKELLSSHSQEVEKVALALLDKEKLDKDGLLTLLGPRPYEEQVTYEDMVKDTGKFTLLK